MFGQLLWGFKSEKLDDYGHLIDCGLIACSRDLVQAATFCLYNRKATTAWVD